MKKLFSLSTVFLVLAVLILPKLSFADWGWGSRPGYHGSHQYYRYHDHPHYGVHVSAFYPNEYYPLWVGGTRYYYDDGLYYNYAGGEYVVANAPVGAVVASIPSDFQPAVINGVTYYTDNGIYYVHTANGYEVVSQPAQAAPVVVANTQNVFDVNVPNDKGGFVTVTLKRSGNGYVGPQGEFYSQFPQISQLRMMYAR